MFVFVFDFVFDVSFFCFASRNTLSSIRKLEGYKNALCYSETMNSLLSVLLYSIRAQIRRMCSKRKSKRTRDLLDTAVCINKMEPELDACMAELNKNFIDAQAVENRMKMPYICCGYVDLVNCATDRLTGTACEPKLPIIVDQVGSIMGNVVNSYCGEYTPDTDKCTKLPRLPGKVSSSSSNNKTRRSNTNSFVINLALIFESINGN